MLRSNIVRGLGYEAEEEVTLLQKKDQQIRRLQGELEQERRRADNAMKMLENFKSMQARH